MKTHPNNTLVRTSLALALALAIWSPTQARSAEPAEDKAKDDKMMEHCQAMKARKEKMMGEMKTQDAELATQVAKMNSAPEDKKMAIMATIITLMTEQRAAIHAQHAKMEEEMMAHMTQHMDMGKDSMAHCPMMKDMKDTKKSTKDPQ